MADTVYVSITGLQLKRPWHAPVFWRHAVASMSQAQRADGCLSADARKINGVHHTLSVWESRDKMLSYLRAGAHQYISDVTTGAFPKAGHVVSIHNDALQ